jgi:hypothetical protein
MVIAWVRKRRQEPRNAALSNTRKTGLATAPRPSPGAPSAPEGQQARGARNGSETGQTADDARQIVRERNLSHVKIGVFDVDGVLRGKYLGRDKFFGALDSGAGFCDVVLGGTPTTSSTTT